MEQLSLDLGGTEHARQIMGCLLRSSGEIAHCRPICTRGEALDRELAQALESRRYHPVVAGFEPTEVPYVFMVSIKSSRNAECVQVQRTERKVALPEPDGRWRPTCERLETDRCINEELALTDVEVGYPPETLARGVRTSAHTDCFLNIDGRLRDCEVRSTWRPSPKPGRELETFLQARRYVPVTSGGRPIEVAYSLTIQISESPDSELRKLESALVREALRWLLSQTSQEDEEQRKREEICVYLPSPLSTAELRRLDPRLRPGERCRGFGRWYFNVAGIERGAEGEIELSVSSGRSGARGTSWRLGATTSPIHLAVLERSEFVE